MKIEKIHIKDFRIFQDVTINFSPNLNCISGYNGVGKSTLLAILSNIGELKKDCGTHINGNPFRGEFSQIVHGDKEYDTSGEKCTIYFNDLPKEQDPKNPFVKELSFRSTFQKVKKTKERKRKINATVEGEEQQLIVLETEEIDGNEDFRYRLIPIKSEERNTESKLSWPTYYLSLSRLYPIGESEEVKSKNNIPIEILEELMQAHKKILSSDDEYLESSSIEISDAKKKKGFGIKTKSYTEKMNSSGQDNLGQILSSVYSFQILKESLNDKYNGGLLLIDEIDATLHPVAQNKLLDFLYEKSKELDLQIVFTTHSISLLEHLVKKQNNFKDKDAFQMIYLSTKRSKLETVVNPSRTFLHNDLMETYSGARRSRKISVLTEDDTARWFLNKILTYHKNIHTFDLNFIEMNTGWTEIIKLIKNDFSYYRNHIVILDPDLNEKENKNNLLNMIKGTQYTVNKKNSNILILPGDYYIEKMMWNYLDSLNPDDEFFYDSQIEQSGVNKHSLNDYGPFSSEYKDYTKEIIKIKNWFEQNKWICDIAFAYWIKEQENEEKVAYFVNNLINAYEPIYHRL
ncbi:ATP-binding protein [Heyndrickxia oleronia]|uniref:ATP-dependent nuclease n=1 Tax=Heyndrickxia oleronia TaxID=38875 RepID=UPI00071711D6